MAAWSSWLETNDANARTRKSTKSVANVFMTIDVDLLDIQDFLKELEDFHL